MIFMTADDKDRRIAELEAENAELRRRLEELERDQFIDVPPVEIDVTEYVRPVRACTGCGAQVYAPLPEDAPAHVFGPGVLALVAVLTGVLNVSPDVTPNLLAARLAKVHLLGVIECSPEQQAAMESKIGASEGVFGRSGSEEKEQTDGGIRNANYLAL